MNISNPLPWRVLGGTGGLSAGAIALRGNTGGPAASATRSKRRGFTMLEMLVAVAVTIILVIFVNQIFSSVTTTVSISMANSEMIEASRTITDEISRDFDQMVPAKSHGFLVISNQEIEAKISADAPTTSVLRADHIAFIRFRGGAEPMTPKTNSNLESDSTAPYIRIYYGHGLRTNPDGSSGGDLGAAGPNLYAADWILARHALFLQHDFTTPGYSSNSVIRVNGGTAGSSVAGYGGSGPSKLSDGIADVAHFGLVDSTSNGSVISTLSSTAGVTDYLAFTFSSSRILCNPKPTYFAGKELLAWQIAQMHPLLANRVSYFAVHFAGDYDATPGIDQFSDNSIKWYGMASKTLDGTFVNPAATREVSSLPANSDPQAPSSGGSAYAFRHGSGATNWPKLVRIRYRLVDRRGYIAGYDYGAGNVFEQVIRIPE